MDFLNMFSGLLLAYILGIATGVQIILIFQHFILKYSNKEEL